MSSDLNQDASYNSASNAAPVGSIVFGTGDGGIIPSTPAGGLVTASPFPPITAPVSVATVLFAGAASFSLGGIDQINVNIPAGTPSGPAAAVVTIGSLSTTNHVTIAVK